METVLWMYFVALLLTIGFKSSDCSADANDAFLQNLEDYDVIIPSRVTREGEHVSYSLHPGHSLRRRSADNVQSIESTEETIHYSVNIYDRPHILKLNRNNKLLSPGFVIERKLNKFKNVTDSAFTRLHESQTNCHFHGQVLGQPDSRVALGLCNGLHGFIHTSDGHYFIEPLGQRPLSPNGHHRHVIYKRSALPSHLDIARVNAHAHKREAEEDDSCGVRDFHNANEQRERWESHQRQRRSTSHHRRKRSFSTERYVETLVVVDPSMIQYHKNEHLETYVLTIMNMVSVMFSDASIGNSINIVLVRILLMEEDQEELVITHHADKTLRSFCKYQKMINFKDDDHPNHHDVAILLTRKNICSRLDEPCGTLGLAEVSGMCQPHRSCSINEDTGLAVAYTVTHELGHNFGMHHDGKRNGCAEPPGHQLYIMSPSLVADSLTKSWSNCSRDAITKFIDRDWGYCLDDEPAPHGYKFPVLPPGTMYDADHQCRLQYGNDNASICGSLQDVCSNLWCQSENRCSTHLEAAAEGTICGQNKWCYEGKCVKIGERPESINGEWGQWTSWTECSRTCGAGVSHSMRHCDNPAPSHGGRYCLGERKRYRICNTDECADDEATFNSVQCEEFNYVPYKDGLYEWEHVPTSETPCQLHCKPKNHFFSVLLKDIVTDGTPCTPGTRNMCISGRCRHIGCDYVIDSSAREDRCGVCHGDGSTCTTVKSQFNESQGLGYVEAAVIPVNARNIRVEEVAEANNFIALQNDKGEYYLNGHWFIQWSGDYKAAGTVIQYERHGNKESIVAAGPLKEPLHVMLLLQSSNPGVEFEYTVPKGNISELREPEFHWFYQPWTHCTASCGGGSQRSEVVCTELEAGVVEDKYCLHNVSTKPDDKQRVCNDHLCPARWWTGPWQHCSVTCGESGVHQRTVICVRSLGPDEQIALDDDACSTAVKPAEVEPCHRKELCPGNSTWVTGHWSDCDSNPCGMKYRTVTCKDTAIGCHGNPSPDSEAPCANIPCGEWAASDWFKCSVSCGEGVQGREVWCEGSDFCDMRYEPHAFQPCNTRPCPTPGSIPVPSTDPVTSFNSPSSPGTVKSGAEWARTTPPSEEDNTPHDHSKTVTNAEKFEEENTLTKTHAHTLKTHSGKHQVSDSTTQAPALDGISSAKYTETAHVNLDASDPMVTDITVQTNGESVEPLQEETRMSTQTETSNDNTQNDNAELEPTDNYINTEVPLLDNFETKHELMDKIGEHEHESDNYGNHTYSVEVEDLDTKDVKDLGVLPTPTNKGDSDQNMDEMDDSTTVDNTATSDHAGIFDERLGGNSPNSITPTVPSIQLTDQKDKDTNQVDDKENGGEHVYDIVEEEFDRLSENDKTANDKNIEEDFPSLPTDSKMPPLEMAEGLGNLPSLEDLPPLPDTNLPQFDKTNVLPYPSPDNLPSLGDLPPLPNLLPNLHVKNIGHLPTFHNEGKESDKPINKNPKKSADKESVEIKPVLDGIDVTDIPQTYSPNSKPTEIQENEMPVQSTKANLLPQKELSQPVEDNTHKRPVDHENTSIQPSIHASKKDAFQPAIHKQHPLDLPKGISKPHLPPMDMNDLDLRLDALESLKREFGDSINIGPANLPVLNPSKDGESGKYTWKPANWTDCSRHCGGGVRTRVVHCVDRESPQHTEVDQFSCDIFTKPTAIEDCNQQRCADWTTADWTQCSATCGHSVRQRHVTCPQGQSCDPKTRPTSEELCDVPPCVKWVSGPWNMCNKQCGGGEQLRLVQCVDVTSQRPGRGCDLAAKPREKQGCNKDPCQNENAALSVRCIHNEMSSIACRALRKMGQCHRRFVALKCCRTCNRDAHKQTNANRPKGRALR